MNDDKITGAFVVEMYRKQHVAEGHEVFVYVNVHKGTIEIECQTCLNRSGYKSKRQKRGRQHREPQFKVGANGLEEK